MSFVDLDAIVRQEHEAVDDVAQLARYGEKVRLRSDVGVGLQDLHLVSFVGAYVREHVRPLTFRCFLRFGPWDLCVPLRFLPLPLSMLEEFEVWLEMCGLYVFVMTTPRPRATMSRKKSVIVG